MHEPLVGRQLLSVLRWAHGGYNAVVVLLFLYQARVGLSIRRARTMHAPLPFSAIKRHRRVGPVLAGAALAGFLFGITLVFLDTGNILEYPPHFATGCVIMLCLAVTVVLSRRIRGQDSPFRTPHTVLGHAILALYFIELVFGISVLL